MGEKKYGFGWLVRHIWNIVFCHNSWNERISRGEFMLSYILLFVLIILVCLLGIPLLSIDPYYASIPFVVSMFVSWFYGLKLMKQRFNDIGIGRKGMWMMFIPSMIFVLALIFSKIFHTQAGFGYISSILSYASGLIALILYLISLWFGMLLMVENGTQGDNRYGSDPLLRQPHSNGIYLRTGFFFFVVYLVVVILVSLSGDIGSILNLS